MLYDVPVKFLKDLILFQDSHYFLFRVEGCDSLKLLTIAATTANPLPHHQANSRAPAMSDKAEKQGNQCCSGGLSQQAGHSQHPTGPSRTLRRSGRDNRAIVRRLKQSEARTTQHQTQDDTYIR